MSEGAYWAVIPTWLLEVESLSDGAKILYGLISSLSRKQGYCWASNSEFAETLRVTERAVRRRIAELEKLGVIDTEFIGVKGKIHHAERRIWLTFPACPDPAQNVHANPDNSVRVKVDKSVQSNMDDSVRGYKDEYNTRNNPPITPQGGKRLPESAKWKPERFEAFWAYYRQNINPANRAAARKAWDKLKPDDDMIHEIGMALKARLRTDEEWKRGIGKPHASTYLNGQQWLDTGPTAPAASRASTQRGAPTREEDEWIL